MCVCVCVCVLCVCVYVCVCVCSTLVVKNLPANAGDAGSIPGSRRSPGGGYGYPLQDTCLENPTEAPGRLLSLGSHTTEHHWSNLALLYMRAKYVCTHTHTHIRTGVVSHVLLQGIFLTQGSNLGVPRCMRLFTVCATINMINTFPLLYHFPWRVALCLSSVYAAFHEWSGQSVQFVESWVNWNKYAYLGEEVKLAICSSFHNIPAFLWGFQTQK